MKVKTNRILLVHIAFWILVIAIRLPMLARVEDPSYYLGTLFLSFFLHSIIFYLFYFFFSNILLKKHLIQFAIFYVLFIVAYSFPVTLFFNFAFNKLMVIGWIKSDPEQSDMTKLYISVVISQSIYALSGTMFRISVDWYVNYRNQEQLEKQNIKNELALLRSQVNPHFLFNTLNNIHSFVYRDQDKTANAIIKLSEIMRYMLYEANSERVLLEKEIDHIKNYIELQKLRFRDPEYVDFKIEGNIHGKTIPPLLLMTLVENAFKHGKKSATAPGISISLKSPDNSLTFNVSNYLGLKSEEKDDFNGFGLKNLERRLKLIYNKTYSFSISKDREKCYVKLQIYNL